jgi:nicotinic acid mononucleotide adenylyltransferase
MDLVSRPHPSSRRVALLSAAWNPPTRAHLALARAALAHAGEVLLTLPRAFPHKEFADTSFETRLHWLRQLAAAHPGLGVAVAESELFLALARALRLADPSIGEVFIVCGSDAAERFLAWNYPPPLPLVEEQLREFCLLVAPRPAVPLSDPRDDLQSHRGADHQVRAGSPDPALPDPIHPTPVTPPVTSRTTSVAQALSLPGRDSSRHSSSAPVAGRLFSSESAAAHWAGLSAESRARILPLPLDDDYDAVSSQDVRERLRAGRAWQHLVPEEIAATVRAPYARGE